MKKVISTLPALILAGCASVTPVSELRTGMETVEFVQVGSEPLGFSFGVVDAGSFWAAYGDGVHSQMGGGALWSGLATSGKQGVADKAGSSAATLRKLYGNHTMVDSVGRSVMPALANLWGAQYRPDSLRVLTRDRLKFDNERSLVNFDGDADLVLMYSVDNVSLTERFSMGGALASGFTMGTNTKNVTTTAFVRLSAFRRDASAGKYTNIWSTTCGANYTQMKSSYPFPEAVKSPEKIAELLDETTAISIENCSKVIEHQSKQAMK